MRMSLVAMLLWLASSAAAEPVRLILDTDMSGDCDDTGALALLHALADRGECEILGTIVNRKDLATASAAATSAINTWYGRPEIPMGTDKIGPTARQETSLFTPASAPRSKAANPVTTRRRPSTRCGVRIRSSGGKSGAGRWWSMKRA
jgi:hypothetical protein